MNMGARHLPAWVLALLVLSSCTTMFKNENQIESDRVELENSRALAFGASGAAFSPDGTQVAVANREQIWIADTATGRVIGRLNATHAAPFGGSKSLEFIDEQHLVIGAQGSIMIWDLKEGLVTHRLPLPNRLYTPRAMAWSEATQTLAYSSGTVGVTVKVVPIKSGGFGRPQDVPGFEGVPSDLVFSRDGRYLGAPGDESGVSVREVATGDAAGELPTEGFVNSLERFGNNKLLVSGANLAIWTFLSDDEAQEFENPDLQGQLNKQIAVRIAGGIALGAMVAVLLPAVAFSALDESMELIAETSYSFAKASYSVASEPLKTSPNSWCGRSNSISPDGKWLADIYPGINKEVVGVYEMEAGEVVRMLHPRGEYSCAVKFSPNGEQLLITSNKAASLYDTKTWKHFDLDLAMP